MSDKASKELTVLDVETRHLVSKYNAEAVIVMILGAEHEGEPLSGGAAILPPGQEREVIRHLDKLRNSLADVAGAEEDKHRVPPCPCPACGKQVDAASLLGREAYVPPTEGDMTVCFYCSAPLRYDKYMKLHPLDPDTLDPEAAAALREAIDKVRFMARIAEVMRGKR